MTERIDIHLALAVQQRALVPCNTCDRDPSTCGQQLFDQDSGVICIRYHTPIQLAEKGVTPFRPRTDAKVTEL